MEKPPGGGGGGGEEADNLADHEPLYYPNCAINLLTHLDFDANFKKRIHISY